MGNAWVKGRLGEALDLAVDRVPVRHTDSYRWAGVYSFGRGLFSRGVVPARTTKYEWLHRLHVDDFVMSKLKAWEGAIAVIPPAFDGFVLSPEFPTYRIDPNRLLPEFLRILCTTPTFWAALQAQSRGMGGRRERVNPRVLLNVEIPIPPVGVQRRIVDLVGSFESVDQHTKTVGLRASALGGSFFAAFDQGEEALLGDIVSLEYGKALKVEDRRGGAVPVFGAAGPIGFHDVACSGPGPTIIVGRKGAHALPTLPLDVRDEAALIAEAMYRGRGGAGSVRWHSSPAWVIDTAYFAVPRCSIDFRMLYWLLVRSRLFGVTTTTTLPGLNREVAYKIPVAVPKAQACSDFLDLLDAAEGLAVRALNVQARVRIARDRVLAELLRGDRALPESYDTLFDMS